MAQHFELVETKLLFAKSINLNVRCLYCVGLVEYAGEAGELEHNRENTREI